MNTGRIGPRRFSVATRKVVDFLLDPHHPDNKGRAKFLAEFGFTTENPLALLEAITGHGSAGTLAKVFDAPHGRKLYYEGAMPSPDGSNPRIRTVWQIDDESSDTARFITLKPLGKSASDP